MSLDCVICHPELHDMCGRCDQRCNEHRETLATKYDGVFTAAHSTYSIGANGVEPIPGEKP